MPALLEAVVEDDDEEEEEEGREEGKLKPAPPCAARTGRTACVRRRPGTMGVAGGATNPAASVADPAIALGANAAAGSLEFDSTSRMRAREVLGEAACMIAALEGRKTAIISGVRPVPVLADAPVNKDDDEEEEEEEERLPAVGVVAVSTAASSKPRLRDTRSVATPLLLKARLCRRLPVTVVMASGADDDEEASEPTAPLLADACTGTACGAMARSDAAAMPPAGAEAESAARAASTPSARSSWLRTSMAMRRRSGAEVRGACRRPPASLPCL